MSYQDDEFDPQAQGDVDFDSAAHLHMSDDFPVDPEEDPLDQLDVLGDESTEETDEDEEM